MGGVCIISVRVSHLSLFFRYRLAHLTWGANRVKTCVAEIFLIFVDGNLGISALEVDEKRKIMKKINFSYFDDVIFQSC